MSNVASFPAILSQRTTYTKEGLRYTVRSCYIPDLKFYFENTIEYGREIILCSNKPTTPIQIKTDITVSKYSIQKIQDFIATQDLRTKKCEALQRKNGAEREWELWKKTAEEACERKKELTPLLLEILLTQHDPHFERGIL